MARDITVTFADGTSHIYRGAPDDATPEQVSQRAQREFNKPVKALDGGRGAPQAVPKPKSALRHTGDILTNAVAGAAQGVVSIPDVAIGGLSGLLRMGAAPVAKASAGMFRGAGMPGAAASVDRNARTFDQALANPATPGRAIEAVAPTLPGYGASRFAAQMLGSMVVPFGKTGAAPPRIPAPRPSAPPVSTNPVAPLGRKAVVRDAVMRRAGVQNPTTGMVTRDPRMWKFEQDTAKLPGVGDELLGAINNVEDDIRRGARTLVDRQGGAIGKEATGAKVNKTLSDKSQALQDEIGALYTQVRDQSGNARIPDLKNTRALSDHPEFADNDIFDGMVAQLNKRLQRYADADGGAAGLSVNQAEQARRFVGKLGGQDPESRLMRKTIQEALDADVLDNFGGAPFAKARAAAAARFSEFGKTLPGKVAAGEVAPERLAENIMQRGVQLKDVRDLRRSLTTGPGAANGQETLNAIGAQVMDDMLKKHIPSEGVIKGGQLFTEFQANAPRLQVILGPQRYKEMRRLAMAARYATADVPKAGVNYSNSATTIAAMLGPEASQKAAGNLLPNFARRATGAVTGAFIGGPGGALAGDQAAAAVNQSMTNKAARAASAKLAEQVAISRDPARAAQLIANAVDDVKLDPVTRRFAKSLADSMGTRPVAAIGAAANNNGMFYQNVPLRASAGETPEDQRR